MRKLFALTVLSLLPLAGCATVTQNHCEVAASQRNMLDLEMRQMAEDNNTFWFLDHQDRLTKWYVR